MLRNFRFIVPGKLAGMGHPGFRDRLPKTLRKLKARGITAIVSLEEEGLPEDFLAEWEMAYRHFPIDDFCPPTIDQAQAFCAFVDEQVSAGGAVAAHCWAGIGRTGTMLACYLIHKGWGADRAIQEVRKTGGIESAEQVAFLHQFAEALRGGT